MTTALKPVEEIKRFADTDYRNPDWFYSRSREWLIDYIRHIATALGALDKYEDLESSSIEYLRSAYCHLVSVLHPAIGLDWVTRWEFLFDEHGQELIVKFLNKHYQDGFTPSGWPVQGVNHLWQVANHVIPDSILWTAEKWAISVLAGEELAENMTPEELER